jgi:hypothetical protein
VDFQPLSERLDGARAREAVQDILAGMAEPFDAVIGRGGDLAGAQHAERAARPSRLGRWRYGTASVIWRTPAPLPSNAN